MVSSFTPEQTCRERSIFKARLIAALHALEMKLAVDGIQGARWAQTVIMVNIFRLVGDSLVTMRFLAFPNFIHFVQLFVMFQVPSFHKKKLQHLRVADIKCTGFRTAFGDSVLLVCDKRCQAKKGVFCHPPTFPAPALELNERATIACCQHWFVLQGLGCRLERQVLPPLI